MIYGNRFQIVPSYSKHKIISSTRFKIVPGYLEHKIISGTITDNHVVRQDKSHRYELQYFAFLCRS
jgi:hypothetical protein